LGHLHETIVRAESSQAEEIRAGRRRRWSQSFASRYSLCWSAYVWWARRIVPIRFGSTAAITSLPMPHERPDGRPLSPFPASVKLRHF